MKSMFECVERQSQQLLPLFTYSRLAKLANTDRPALNAAGFCLCTDLANRQTGVVARVISAIMAETGDSRFPPLWRKVKAEELAEKIFAIMAKTGLAGGKTGSRSYAPIWRI
jgi:hypothetical protein